MSFCTNSKHFLVCYSATTITRATETKLTNLITQKQQYIPRKLVVGQSAAHKKNKLLEAQNLNIDSKRFPKSKIFR